MNKLILVIGACFMLSGAAYADSATSVNEEGDQGSSKMENQSSNMSERHKMWEMHKKVMLTREQREKIRDAVFKYKETKIHLEETVKLARLNYKKVQTDPSSDAKAAKSAAQDVVEGVSKLVAAKLALKNQITYQILTEGQRKARQFHSMFMGGEGRHEKKFHKGGNRKSFAENSAEEEAPFDVGPESDLVSMDEASDMESI